jgi:hypothetical protein
MRILLAAAALTLALASPASAEFFPVDQGFPPPPCDDTPDPSLGQGIVTTAACLPQQGPRLPSESQLKLIVAFKVRAIWGSYAARHITRYGCGTYVLRTSTVCAVRFRTKRQNVVTRRLRLKFVITDERSAGVRVSRVPPYAPPTSTTPTDSGPPFTTGDSSTSPDPAVPVSDG